MKRQLLQQKESIIDQTTTKNEKTKQDIVHVKQGQVERNADAPTIGKPCRPTYPERLLIKRYNFLLTFDAIQLE